MDALGPLIGLWLLLVTITIFSIIFTILYLSGPICFVIVCLVLYYGVKVLIFLLKLPFLIIAYPFILLFRIFGARRVKKVTKLPTGSVVLIEDAELSMG
jgi:hypothetical protein